ncbi:MAG: hypothetical protein KDD58_14685 [Bdellovibrionales bacterium]|nr:hypothetical protein [Bdellovibrionales bacterium]
MKDKSKKEQAESKARSQSGVWSRRGTEKKKKAASQMKTRTVVKNAKKSVTVKSK